MSYFLTARVAEAAVKIVLPSIEHFLKTGFPKRPCLHLVVMDPTNPYHVGMPQTQAILFEYSVNMENWTGIQFDAIARSKAWASHRTGLSSAELRNCPALYDPGDAKYGGSAIYKGVIAAASGVQEYFDEMFAMWLAVTCHALAVHEFQFTMISDKDFVGD